MQEQIKLKEMDFNKKKLAREFIKIRDALFAINGGLSQFVVQQKKEDKCYNLVVKAPGVSDESIRVEIKDNNLFIYYLLRFAVEETESHLIPSYLIKSIEIPYDVDILNISADFHDDTLVVHMPFNPLAQGYQKNVDIHHI